MQQDKENAIYNWCSRCSAQFTTVVEKDAQDTSTPWVCMLKPYQGTKQMMSVKSHTVDKKLEALE